MKKYVIKSSGEKELFDPEKFRRSLRHAGAKPAVIESLLESVKKIHNLKQPIKFIILLCKH